MTLANKITLLRIFFIPLIVIALLNGARIWALGIYAFCAFTDALDGFLARHYKQNTPLGTFLDPLADKLLLTSIFLTLAFLSEIPKWVFVAVFSRDVIIISGWLVVYFLTGSSRIEPRSIGKATTFFQMSASLAAMVGLTGTILTPLFCVMAAFTILSGLDYVLVGTRSLSHLERS